MIAEPIRCFENFIGVRDLCTPVRPTSGHYINDVAPITTEFANKVCPSGYKNGTEFLQDKINVAIRRFRDDLTTKFDSYFRLSTVIDRQKFGTFGTEYNAYLNHDRGVVIYRTKAKELQALRLDTLQVFSKDAAQNVVITINDGAYGIYTKTVNLVANQVQYIDCSDIPVLKSPSVYIYWNTANLQTYKQVNTGFSPCGCCGYKSYCCQGSQKLFSIYGYDATSNRTYDNFFGIIPEISLICDYDSLFCQLRTNLSTVLLYYCACEIIQAGLNTDRVSEYSSEHWQEKLGEIYKGYMETNTIRLNSIVESFTNVLSGMNDKDCIVCRSNRLTYTV